MTFKDLKPGDVILTVDNKTGHMIVSVALLKNERKFKLFMIFGSLFPAKVLWSWICGDDDIVYLTILRNGAVVNTA